MRQLVTRPARKRGEGTMTTKKPLKPGNTSPNSGQYEEVTPTGKGTGHEVTVPKGRPLPPTTKPGNGYKLVDRTKNDSGRK